MWMFLTSPSVALAGGSAWLSPESAQVATKATIELHYEVGPEGMQVGDAVQITDPDFHGVRWSLWGNDVLDPALCTPNGEGVTPSNSLLTARTTGAATLGLERNTPPEGGSSAVAAWSTITVQSGELLPGDEVVLVIGDTEGGPDCGHEMPVRAYHQVEIPVAEDLDGEGFVPLAESPTLDITPLPEATSLLVTMPSVVPVGQEVRMKVAALDDYGNPVEALEGRVTLSAEWGRRSAPLRNGVADLIVAPHEAGVFRVTVNGPGDLTGRSNPVEVLDVAPDLFLYWGDLHVHFGHSYEYEGQLINENVRYARDVIGMDVICESAKAHPVTLDLEALWSELQSNCTEDSVEGRFLVMLGMEWMSNSAGSDDGHHNFYYDSCEAPEAAHYTELTPEGISDFDGGQGPYVFAERLLATLGIRTVIVPHASRFTGYNWTDRDDTWRRAAEVFSEWGNCMEPPGEPDSVPQGLAMGNRFGFIASSDNHDGWMGNPYAKKTIFQGGLAAFWAPNLGREAIFEALHGRSTYATSGARILLRASMEDGAQIRSGLEYVAEAPEYRWEAHGTEPISRVRLFSVPTTGAAEPTMLREWLPGTLDAGGEHAWEWDGSDIAVWLEVDQVDGNQAWSSPIWLTTACDREGVTDPAGRCIPEHSDPPDSPEDSPEDTEESTPWTEDPPLVVPEPRNGCAGRSAALALVAVGLALRARARGAWTRPT